MVRTRRAKPLQCIVVLDTEEDKRKMIQSLSSVLFNGYPLRFKHWKHPMDMARNIKLQLTKKSDKKKAVKASMPQSKEAADKMMAYSFGDTSMKMKMMTAHEM